SGVGTCLPLAIDVAVAVRAVVGLARVGMRIDPGVIVVVNGGETLEPQDRRPVRCGNGSDAITGLAGDQAACFGGRRQTEEPARIADDTLPFALPTDAGLCGGTVGIDDGSDNNGLAFGSQPGGEHDRRQEPCNAVALWRR